MKNRIFSIIILLIPILLISCFQSNEIKRENKELIITTSDSTNLYVKISGQGQACIFIHGGPGAWSKSFELMNGNKLENDFKMVYFDQRGCGRSSNSNDYSLTRMIDDIEEIRISLNLGQIFIIGHSFGGILATEYTAKYPKRVQGLILLNSTLDILESLSSQIQMANKLIGKDMFSSKKDSSILYEFSKAKEELNSINLSYKTLSNNELTFKLLDSIDQTSNSSFDFAKKVWDYPVYIQNFTTQTKSINTPTLIITGTEDYAVGIDHYKSFKFQTQYVNQIQGGHLLYYENTKETIKAIKEFYNKTTANK